MEDGVIYNDLQNIITRSRLFRTTLVLIAYYKNNSMIAVSLLLPYLLV